MPKSIGLVPAKDMPFVRKEARKLAAKLLQGRLDANLTQEALAAALGLSRDIIARYERANRIPSVPTLFRMERVLNIKLIQT